MNTLPCNRVKLYIWQNLIDWVKCNIQLAAGDRRRIEDMWHQKVCNKGTSNTCKFRGKKNQDSRHKAKLLMVMMRRVRANCPQTMTELLFPQLFHCLTASPILSIFPSLILACGSKPGNRVPPTLQDGLPNIERPRIYSRHTIVTSFQREGQGLSYISNSLLSILFFFHFPGWSCPCWDFLLLVARGPLLVVSSSPFSILWHPCEYATVTLRPCFHSAYYSLRTPGAGTEKEGSERQPVTSTQESSSISALILRLHRLDRVLTPPLLLPWNNR